jgi:hypothetical protein
MHIYFNSIVPCTLLYLTRHLPLSFQPITAYVLLSSTEGGTCLANSPWKHAILLENEHKFYNITPLHTHKVTTAYRNYINPPKNWQEIKSCLKHFKSECHHYTTRQLLDQPTLIFKQHEVRRSTDTIVCEVQHSQHNTRFHYHTVDISKIEQMKTRAQVG